MKQTLFLVCLLGLLNQVGFAQDFDREKLDRYFEALEQNDKFMGSVAVSQNGELIYTKSVGFCDLENNEKPDQDSKYRIGSISKTFTAVLTLLAVEHDRLQLDQTLDDFFTTIPNADRITITNLLNHRSGIHNFTSDPDYLTWLTEAKTEQEMVEIITNAGSDFEPGRRAAYSNSNYVLLSYILEKAFEQSYENILTEYITRPVGLENTFLGGKINPKNNECNSYRFANSWKIEPETDISIPLGAGGIVSTPSDLVKFSDALFAGKILREESLEKMKTIEDNFGRGLYQMPFNGRTGLGHSGVIDGFSSTFIHYTDGGISYAMISNGTSYKNNNISIAVLRAVYGMPFTVPEFKAFDVSPEELDQYVGTYTSSQFPLDITITKEDGVLKGQATGQSAFPLIATDKDKFEFDQAGLVLEFNPSEETMIMKQGGGAFEFKKE
ncbi:beta-lactamase family protein [Litoribacter alkaliphilus]|uniref:Beta-lactamase family protein n=1 Tax=Litoribacter ruber TaxID=702568 RepID=A0AAP2CIR6_9BACT|nr:serine hydrolase domain-containing protein [Litoribacter alkaliphilus]MBS9522582.1 beta-lactamase family protein [Litoribacter alkaliphilus]